MKEPRLELNIETPDPLKLPFLPLSEKGDLPNCCAIYFVLSESNEVLYIGSSKRLFARWVGHHRKDDFKSRGENLKIAWLECSNEELLRTIEMSLIETFDPPLNIRGKFRKREGSIVSITRDFILRVRLTEQEKLWLSAEAVRRGVSMSEVVRDYVKSLNPLGG